MISHKRTLQFLTYVKFLYLIPYHAPWQTGPLHQSSSLTFVSFHVYFYWKCFTFTVTSLSWNNFSLALLALSRPRATKIQSWSSKDFNARTCSRIETQRQKFQYTNLWPKQPRDVAKNLAIKGDGSADVRKRAIITPRWTSYYFSAFSFFFPFSFSPLTG